MVEVPEEDVLAISAKTPVRCLSMAEVQKQVGFAIAFVTTSSAFIVVVTPAQFYQNLGS